VDPCDRCWMLAFLIVAVVAGPSPVVALACDSSRPPPVNMHPSFDDPRRLAVARGRGSSPIPIRGRHAGRWLARRRDRHARHDRGRWIHPRRGSARSSCNGEAERMLRHVLRRLSR